MKSIFGLSMARLSMIREARNPGRRCTMLTLLANLVRKVASSMAESPPPTTISSLSRKKKPSQVAQAETPWPIRRVSDSISRSRAEAPVATITASAVKTVPSASTLNGVPEKSTAVAVL